MTKNPAFAILYLIVKVVLAGGSLGGEAVKNIASAICFVLVSAMGLSLIGCGDSVQRKDEWQIAAERPVLTLEAIQIYDGWKVHDVDDAKNVICLTHNEVDDRGYVTCRDVRVHLDSRTYDLVKGWGRVKWGELEKVQKQNGYPPTEPQQSKSLKQEAR